MPQIHPSLSKICSDALHEHQQIAEIFRSLGEIGHRDYGIYLTTKKKIVLFGDVNVNVR